MFVKILWGLRMVEDLLIDGQGFAGSVIPGNVLEFTVSLESHFLLQSRIVENGDDEIS